MTLLEIKSITKEFSPGVKVIDKLTFDVNEGEFLTILGSSGCGKTTLLRIIAGLEEASSGTLLLDGRDITDLDPNLRPVNMVFQSYALFPHMNVWDNVGYALRIKGKGKGEIKEAVDNALELVQMKSYENRRPHELSGGQRQRVAIARAIAAKPRILLLDEPLGALDLNLRRTMQTELKALQKNLGITFIYITHDQEEALNMSDRIAVMKGGKFMQIGSPAEIYDSPKNAAIARFVGESNVLSGTFIRYIDDGAEVEILDNNIKVRNGSCGVKYNPGDKVSASLRGEAVEIGSNNIFGVIKSLGFSGGVMHICAQCRDMDINIHRYGLDTSLCIGDKITLGIPDYAAVLLESEGT